MTYDPDKFGPLGRADDERKRLVAAFQREDALQLKLDELEAAGDKLAVAVETRWSGDGRCDCECCAAARDWRKARSA